MKEIKLQKISFKSYVKLHIISGLGFGIIYGIYALVLSFIDGDSVYVTFGGQVTTGIKAGIANLILGPIMMPVVFTIFSLFLYLGFSLIMKFKKTIKMKIQISK